MVSRASRTTLCTLLAVGVLALCHCEERDKPSRPRGPCWMGLDTLLVTGEHVSDTTGVRIAFVEYLACVDTAGCASQWVDSSHPMRYFSSEFCRTYHGRAYWQVWHLEFRPEYGGWTPRTWYCVDENGVVV